MLVSTETTFGAVLRSYRRDRGWKQQELSRRTGIKQSYISALENDQAGRPSGATLMKLADAFGVTVEALMSATPIPLPGPIDQLSGQGLPEWVIEDLSLMWPDLMPEDRDAVIEHTRALWERRTRGRGKQKPNTQPMPEG